MSAQTASFTDGLRREIFIFFVLLVMTGIMIASSFINLGVFNTVIVLTIAFVQTLLVLLYFMHLNESSGFIKLLTFGAFLWVGVMFGLTLNDFVSRQFVSSKLEPQTWINRAPVQYTNAAGATEHQK